MSEQARSISLILLSTLLFLGLVTAASSGLRGSDQYWYTAEVQQLMSGGEAVSNVVFPFHATRGFVPPPFNHHSLAHYLVLPFASVLGAYGGWIVLNLISIFVAAALIAILAHSFAGYSAAVLSYTATLLLPLCFWTSGQPYLEVVLAGLVVLGVFVYVRSPEKSAFTWLALLLICFAAYLCRLSFLPLLFVLPILYGIHIGIHGARNISVIVLLTLSAFFAVTYGALIFESDPALTLVRYLNARVPNVSDNMHVLYSIHDEPLEAWKLFIKVVAGLWLQFTKGPLTVQLFYLPFNIMLLITIWFWMPKLVNADTDVKERKLAGALLFFTLLHLAVAALRGNEFRFLMVITPVLILSTSIVIARSNIFRARWSSLVVAICLALFITNIPLTMKLRAEAESDVELRRALSEAFDKSFQGAEGGLIIGAVDTFLREELVVGYLMRPRLTLMVKTNYGYSNGELEQMRDSISGKWLFAQEESPLVAVFEGKPLPTSFPSPFDDYRIYSIGKNVQKKTISSN